MPSRFQERMSRLGDRMKECNSVPIKVRRTGVGEIVLQATPLYTQQQEMIPGVAITQVHYMDWGITLADLTFDGTPTVPKRDDEIETEDGLVFLVVTREGKKAPFYYTTSARDRVRVSSDRIA